MWTIRRVFEPFKGAFGLTGFSKATANNPGLLSQSKLDALTKLHEFAIKEGSSDVGDLHRRFH